MSYFIVIFSLEFLQSSNPSSRLEGRGRFIALIGLADVAVVVLVVVTIVVSVKHGS